jgi:hypothetical protein
MPSTNPDTTGSHPAVSIPPITSEEIREAIQIIFASVAEHRAIIDADHVAIATLQAINSHVVLEAIDDQERTLRDALQRIGDCEQDIAARLFK